MHELGVVFHVMDTCKDVAKKNNAKHIRAVSLEIGEVSTVIPDLLRDCWKWAVSKDEMMTDCELKITGIKAMTHCASCGKDYPTTVFEKICPYCGSDDTYLITGDEFLI
ncbi:MAG: hydrogenase maturation nickel metallochaperone HypA, partial [Lachnospiraceae bacterium]|nr:hydrogenase maturation nickel metallochaperone HypA [Lachnospiraceae bacterium]